MSFSSVFSAAGGKESCERGTEETSDLTCHKIGLNLSRRSLQDSA